MPDPGDLDQLMKAAVKAIEDWGKELEKIAKALDKAGADADEGGGDKKDPKVEKAQQQAVKDFDSAGKDLDKKLSGLKFPPKPDPKQIQTLPKFLTTHINKNGFKIGDYGSIKPKLDIDFKKPKINEAGVVWTIEF